MNHKGERWELQLKGAGQTPYSRNADGRAVLRSSIREFLCSEAMFWLGIPTTRAGIVITSDTYVIRDLRYNGNPIRERATVVLRLSPTFLRFGSFEICRGVDPETGREGPSKGNTEILGTLLDYTLQYHYPHIFNLSPSDKELEEFNGGPITLDKKNNLIKQFKYYTFYKEVVDRSVNLVSHWMSVGWSHGVLNTDNCSIIGVTIDYGPFGFMDTYNPDFICNATG